MDRGSSYLLSSKILHGSRIYNRKYYDISFNLLDWKEIQTCTRDYSRQTEQPMYERYSMAETREKKSKSNTEEMVKQSEIKFS